MDTVLTNAVMFPLSGGVSSGFLFQMFGFCVVVHCSRLSLSYVAVGMYLNALPEMTIVSFFVFYPSFVIISCVKAPLAIV